MTGEARKLVRMLIVTALKLLVSILGGVNATALWIGRQVALVLLAFMVVVVVYSIFYRTFSGNSLSWVEEGIRYLMIWMAMLAAPTALRLKGFVAIEFFKDLFTGRARHMLELIYWIMIAIVFLYLLESAWAFFWTDGFWGTTSTLWYPKNLSAYFFDPAVTELRFRKMPPAVTNLSMPVGVLMLLSVSVEWILREIVMVIDPHADMELSSDDSDQIASAD